MSINLDEEEFVLLSDLEEESPPPPPPSCPSPSFNSDDESNEKKTLVQRQQNYDQEPQPKPKQQQSQQEEEEKGRSSSLPSFKKRWTIEITRIDDCYDDESSPDIYQVNREVVWNHFRRLLSSSQKKLLKNNNYYYADTENDKQSRAIPLQVPTLIANVFPNLIDFLQQQQLHQDGTTTTTATTKTVDLEMTTTTSTALYYIGSRILSKSFPALAQYARNYIEEYMDCSNVHVYYFHSIALNVTKDPTIPNLVLQFMANNLMKISPHHPIVAQNSNPQLWLHLLDHPVLDLCQNKELCRHFTKLFTTFVTKQPKSITAATFQRILSADTTPYIDPESALTLAELDHTMFSPLQQNERAAQPLLLHGKSLRHRCARAMAVKWCDLMTMTNNNNNNNEKENILKRLRSLDSMFLVDLMEFVNEISNNNKSIKSNAQREQASDDYSRRAALRARIQKEKLPLIRSWNQDVLVQKDKDLKGVSKIFGPFCNAKDIQVSTEYQVWRNKYADLVDDYDLVMAVKYAKMMDGGNNTNNKHPVDAKTGIMSPRSPSKPASVLALERSTCDASTPNATIHYHHRKRAQKDTENLRGSRVLWIGQGQEEVIHPMDKSPPPASLSPPPPSLLRHEGTDLGMGDLFFYRAKDNVEYSVNLVQMFPDGKCWIRFKNYGSFKLVKTSKLLRATPERLSAYSSWQSVAVQEWF